MDPKAESRQADELMLINYELGRCEGAAAAELLARLAADDGLRRVHQDIRNTFAALQLSADCEPPADLVDSTVCRIRAARKTDALLAREELGRRDVIRSTFSLRELAAIAAIALLLVSVFGVSVREAERRKARTECASRLARVGAAMLGYANRNDGYLPATGLPERRWLPAEGQPAVSNSSSLFRLVRDRYVSPASFQCPAVGGESFVLQAGMTDFPHQRAVSYSYQYSLGPRGLCVEDARIAPVKASVVILADDNPVFQDGQFRRERVRRPISHNHDGLGQNVLYLPGQVEFQRRPSVGVLGNNIYLAEGVYEYDGDEAPTSPTDTFLLPAYTGRQGGREQQAPKSPR